MFYNKKKGTCKEIFVNQTKCTLLIFFGNRLAFMKHIKFSFAFSHRSFATTKCSFMEILKRLFFLLRLILYDDYSWEVFSKCLYANYFIAAELPENSQQSEAVGCQSCATSCNGQFTAFLQFSRLPNRVGAWLSANNLSQHFFT